MFPEVNIVFPQRLGGQIKKWLVKPGDKVNKLQPLAECECLTGGGFPTTVELKSPFDGTILELVKGDGSKIEPRVKGATATEIASDPKQIVARMNHCSHAQVFGGLCGVCGRKVASTATESGVISKHHKPISVAGQKLHVNREEAESHNERTVSRLFKQKRLSLVLDLDHTLLHATNDHRAPAFAARKGATHESFQVADPNSKEGNTLQLYAHLRPGLNEWLEELHKYYELYIYTAGTRVYAEAIAKIIDPSGKFFGPRILSRTDVPELGHSIKSLERFFPIDHSMAVIVDDRADVWLGSKNLVTIEPYHFWKHMSDVNNASGKVHKANSSEQSSLSKGMNRGLRRVMDLLLWVHRHFYGPNSTGQTATIEQQLAGQGSSVPKLLGELKSRVLGGKPIYFVLDSAMSPRRLEKVRTNLLALGGVIGDMTNMTHAIAEHPESPFALESKRLQKWVIHPDWVDACDHHWIHEPESSFSIYSIHKSKKREIVDKEGATAASSTVSMEAIPEEPSNGDQGVQDEEDGEDVDEFGYPVTKKQKTAS